MSESRKLDYHPLANEFPLLEGTDFKELVEDIEANGQREPIVLYEGKVLDGRNRHRACAVLGIAPVCRDLAADENPVAYVVSANLRRRHLDVTERAQLAAKLLPLFEAEAKQRQQHHGQTAPGKRRLTEEEKHLASLEAKCYPPETPDGGGTAGKAAAQAARAANVSRSSVERAKSRGQTHTTADDMEHRWR